MKNTWAHITLHSCPSRFLQSFSRRSWWVWSRPTPTSSTTCCEGSSGNHDNQSVEKPHQYHRVNRCDISVCLLHSGSHLTVDSSSESGGRRDTGASLDSVGASSGSLSPLEPPSPLFPPDGSGGEGSLTSEVFLNVLKLNQSRKRQDVRYGTKFTGVTSHGLSVFLPSCFLTRVCWDVKCGSSTT